LRRHSGCQEQGFKIRRCTFLVRAGALHSLRGCRGVRDELVSTQRDPQGDADPIGYAGIIEEDERIPRIEENGPNRPLRSGVQRNRRSAPRPSMASRASD
jgi:hypothetical protein